MTPMRKRRHWELPPTLLRQVLLFIREPKGLVTAALAFPGGLAAVKSLPDWHGQLLKGGEVLEDHPFPITRAIAICLNRHCEVCGRGRVQGVKQPFGVFAHDQCLEAHLRNGYYLDTQKLKAAGAPSLFKTGYNPYARSGYRDWSMTMYWEELSPLIEPCWTAHGTKGLTMAQCQKAGKGCDRGRAVLLIAL